MRHHASNDKHFLLVVPITATRADIQESDDYDDGSPSKSSSQTLLYDRMKGPSTSKPRVRDTVNLMTPEVAAAAVEATNRSDSKVAYLFSSSAMA